MRISDWSSDVCSSDLEDRRMGGVAVDGLGAADEMERGRIEAEAPQIGEHAHSHDFPMGLGRVGVGRREADDRDGAGTQEVRDAVGVIGHVSGRSEEHTSELQSLMRNSYAVFCLKKKKLKTAAHLNN